MAENREAQPHVIMMPMSTGRNRGAWVQSRCRSFVRWDGGRVAEIEVEAEVEGRGPCSHFLCRHEECTRENAEGR